MKIAITRLSGNITDKNKELVGNKELFGIAQLLKQKFDIVDILSCKECGDCIYINEEFDINYYDKLLILNDSVNMFGGLEIKTMTTIFKLLHKFNNQIYYILTDLSLPFIDYYKLIKNKPWNNYNEDDFKLQNEIIILSQSWNIDLVKRLHKNISVKNIVYVPFEQWKVFTESSVTNDNRYIDLIYGGSFRTGRREEKFKDYFFDKEDINITIYGNMKLSQFKNITSITPKFLGKIPNNKVIDMNSNSLATILMGDKNYNNNIITLRYVEALLSNTICFIDLDFDTNQTIIDCEYLYVKNGKELINKIKELKINKELYNKLLIIQNNKLQQIINNNLPQLLYDILGGNNEN